GTVTGHASATLTILGVSVTRATDGSQTADSNGVFNSGDAVKTFVAGKLLWKKVDGASNLLGGATFQVCATAGTAASAGHSPLCVTILDNDSHDANKTDGLFELDSYQSFGGSALGGLALGTYTIEETQAPPGFTKISTKATVTLTQSSLDGGT